LSILSSEKQDNIIGRPAPVSFRKVFYGIVYVLECLKNWRQCQWKIDVAKGLWFRFDMSYKISAMVSIKYLGFCTS